MIRLGWNWFVKLELAWACWLCWFMPRCSGNGIFTNRIHTSMRFALRCVRPRFSLCCRRSLHFKSYFVFLCNLWVLWYLCLWIFIFRHDNSTWKNSSRQQYCNKTIDTRGNGGFAGTSSARWNTLPMLQLLRPLKPLRHLLWQKNRHKLYRKTK